MSSAEYLEQLPYFKYHPDPLVTGVIEPSNVVCISCSQARGFIYKGSVYSESELHNRLCPWCIADGSAARQCEAEFTAYVGGFGWQTVADDIVDEVLHRTPGYIPWQTAYWWTHCDDAAAFLGYAGYEDLIGRWAGAVPVIRAFGNFEAPDFDQRWEQVLRALDPSGSVIAYVFQCLHCGALGGHWDCD